MPRTPRNEETCSRCPWRSARAIMINDASSGGGSRVALTPLNLHPSGERKGRSPTHRKSESMTSKPQESAVGHRARVNHLVNTA